MHHYIILYANGILHSNFIFGNDYVLDLLLQLLIRVYIIIRIHKFGLEDLLLFSNFVSLSNLLPDGLSCIPDRFEDEL